jgi:23S rRNA pseudouridine1911/1915/1917 synthase
MAALRHPCCGDLLYGADPVLAAHLGLTRQWLHAVELSFGHPATGREISFESSYPEDLARALDILRAES